MKIQFNVASTKYTVQSLEKQAIVEAYCSKIKRFTGVTKHVFDKKHSSNPFYPRFMEGMSTAFYVREYEALNNQRFIKPNSKAQSLFDNLSTNSQFAQDDSHVEESIE